MKKRVSIIMLLILVAFTTNIFAEIIPSDRKIDWNPGIPGGIPSRTTIFANVKNAPYNAAGNGVADDTTAIQSAINACPEGQVVYIPAGTYNITSTLSFSKGIVLRGDGPENTIIQLTNPSTRHVVYVAGPGRIGSVLQMPLVGSFAKGSTTLTIDTSDSDQSLFQAGKYIIVGQSDGTNPDIVRGGCDWGKLSNNIDNDYASLGQMASIVSRNGNTITISPALYLARDSQYNPFIALVVDSGSVVSYAGIEDLKLERTTAGDGSFGNGGSIITFWKCVYSWVRNVETFKVDGQHISLQVSYGCEVRDSYWSEAWTYSSGGRSYGLNLRWYSGANLVTNNIGMYLNSAGVMFAGSGGGNVISYNYFDGSWVSDGSPTWMVKNVGSHCSHPYMELIEGNYLTQVGSDSIHGSASHFTIFRNHIDTDHTYPNKPDHQYNDTGMVGGVRLDLAYYTNVVGNVIGQPSYPHSPTTQYYECNTVNECNSGHSSKRRMYIFRTNDSKVYSTTLRHANFDYYNNSTVWDSDISDQNIPNSYYLSSKPSFFECRDWPPVGSDKSPMVGSLPAKDRFEGINPCSGLPTIPGGFTITNQ